MDRAARLAVGFVLLVLVACAHEAPPPPVAASSDLVVPPLAKRCSVNLVVGTITKSSSTCYLDQNVERGGVLQMPCGGDGPAEAIFAGGLHYLGEVSGGEIRLAAHTELEWDGDGCRWGTTGTIRGTTARLEWRYADEVLRGERCSDACTASASLDVHE